MRFQMRSERSDCEPTRRGTVAWIKSLFTAAGLVILLTTLAHGQGYQFAFDGNGNLLTQAAEIGALPQILGQPQPQVVEPGELASFSVVAADLKGLTYQWRFNGTNIGGGTSDALLLLNVGATNEGLYSVVLANSSGSVTSAPAALMLDADHDQLPDSWELAHFGNLNQTATGDFDHDGVSNLDEFRDGTDPASSSSARFRLTVGSGGGVVSVIPSKLTYTNGEAVMLTATPTSPNTFHGWTGSTNSQSNPLILVMNSNKTLQANFISAEPPPGLLAWWRAESNALDSIGGHHGTVHGGLTYAKGNVGQSFALDGVNSYVSIPDSPALHSASITLEAWAMFASSGGPVIAKPKGILGVDSYSLVVAGGNLVGSAAGEFQHLPFSPVPGRWYHLVFTYDDASRAKLIYLDGVLVSVGLAQPGASISYDNRPLLLGGDTDTGSPTALLNGRVDEASIYNRALTYPEIKGLYNAGINGKSVTSPYFTSATPLPTAARWVPYSQQITTALGLDPVVFSVSSGTLPIGLTLSSSGLLSGLPTSPGTNTFGILATDANGRSAEKAFSLAVVQPATPAGMVGWWRAEANATDAVTNRHGTAVGTVGYGAGVVGQAFGLNGVGYITIPDSPSANGSYDLEPSSLTLEAWVKINQSNGRIFAKPLTLGAPGPGWDSFSMWLSFGGTLHAGVTDTNGSLHELITSVLSAGTWYHLAFTYDGGSKVESLYVNGVLVATAFNVENVGYCVNCGNSPAHDTHDVMLGAHLINTGSAFDFFDGSIDEAAIYNRALSPGEISAIYNVGEVGKLYLSDFQQWKLAYLGDPNAPDSGDPDGDGSNNLQEYLVGTNPTNSASTLRITSIAKENNDIRVNWIMGSGTICALQSAPNLASNFGDLVIITNATGSVANYLDQGAATNASARFYRVRFVSFAPPQGPLRLTGNSHTMNGDLGYSWNNTSFAGGAKIYFDYGDNGFGGPSDTSGSTEVSLSPNITITNGLHLQVRGDFAQPNYASLHLVLTHSDTTTFSLNLPNTTVNTAFTPVAFSDSNGDHWQVSGNLATGGDLVSGADSVPNGNVTAPFNNPDTSWHLTFTNVPSSIKLTGNGHTMHSNNGYSWDALQNGVSDLYFDVGDDNSFDTGGDTVASLAPNITITNGMRLQVRGNLVAPITGNISLLLVLTLTDNTALNLNFPATSYATTPGSTVFTPVAFSDSNGDHWQVSGNLATGGDLVGGIGIGSDGFPDTSWHLTLTKVP